MVCASLRNSIPKSVVYCQVREAKRSLLDYFFAELGKKEVRTLNCFFNFHLCYGRVAVAAEWVLNNYYIYMYVSDKTVVFLVGRGSSSDAATYLPCEETGIVQKCPSRD